MRSDEARKLASRDSNDWNPSGAFQITPHEPQTRKSPKQMLPVARSRLPVGSPHTDRIIYDDSGGDGAA